MEHIESFKKFTNVISEQVSLEASMFYWEQISTIGIKNNTRIVNIYIEPLKINISSYEFGCVSSKPIIMFYLMQNKGISNTDL